MCINVKTPSMHLTLWTKLQGFSSLVKMLLWKLLDICLMLRNDNKSRYIVSKRVHKLRAIFRKSSENVRKMVRNLRKMFANIREMFGYLPKIVIITILRLSYVLAVLCWDWLVWLSSSASSSSSSSETSSESFFLLFFSLFSTWWEKQKAKY